MSHHCHGLPLRVELQNEVAQPLFLLVILPDRRLVQDQIVRLPSQDRRQGHPLPLAATQQERRCVRVMSQIKRLESPLYLFHDDARLEAEVLQSKPNLLPDSFREKQMIRILKHNPNFSRQLSNALLRGVISIDRDPSQSRLQQAIQLLRQRCLSRAVLAHDREKIAAVDLQIDRVQRQLTGRISEGDLLDKDQLRSLSDSILAADSTCVGRRSETRPSLFSSDQRRLTLGRPIPNPLNRSNSESRTS